MIVLTDREEELVKAVRRLPEGTAEKIILWASQLADLAPGKAINWSDIWTAEDREDATSASRRRFEEREISRCRNQGPA